MFGTIPQPSSPCLSSLTSELDQVILPEIKGDEFYHLIQKLSEEESIHTVLEIGSSAGGGSTEAFVTGLRKNSNHPELFCMEVSRLRFAELDNRYRDTGFVRCYNVSSVPSTNFPLPSEVAAFYASVQTNLNSYPLQKILGWLQQDIDYVRQTGCDEDGIARIRRENKIDTFDMVLIDGSEFTGTAELEQVYGARWLLLDDINAYKNYYNYHRLKNDPAYELYRENWQLRNGYAIFRKREETLPIHFFTIVLNGEPFIRYHIEMLLQLPFRWHWHIVEGVAEHKYDTAWSLQFGGRVAESLHNNGLSNDGTTVYLDELKQKYPELITIYRKPKGKLWGGKVEMVSAPLTNINEECLLWQLDVDELWTTQQFQDAHALFQQYPNRMAAHYWCWFFVGPDKVVSSRYCYSQNPRQEWLRTWRYLPGMTWAAHEPPQLVITAADGSLFDVGQIQPFLHDETERAGLVFQHYAYALESQLQFKEIYYGYRGAVTGWRELQLQRQFPVYLRKYFSWVHDDTVVDSVAACNVTPLLQLDTIGSDFRATRTPKIIIDGVIFQLYNTGIARVWQTLFCEWIANGFAASLLVLDRVETAPRLEGLAYREIMAYNYDATDQDRQLLQQVCDEEHADLFVSTYYTTPLSTRSVFYAHDMIPEKTSYFDLKHPFWREKHYGIRHATHFIAVSRNTACDLVAFYPQAQGRITIAPNAVDPDTFYPASAEEQRLFVQHCGIRKPYFLIVGGRGSYKNVRLFFEAFAMLPNKFDYEIVCCGGAQQLEPEFAKLVVGTTVHLVGLSDAGLRAAYSLALAYVYPSAYEGFGLTMLEAMACNCPVITCHNSALPEVAGAAALYVDEIDPQEMLAALQQVQQPAVRSWLIQAGQQQLQKFSWHKTAQVVQEALISLCDRNNRHA